MRTSIIIQALRDIIKTLDHIEPDTDLAIAMLADLIATLEEET